MKNIKLLSYFILAFIQFYGMSTSYALQLISADNERFLYTGRVEYSEPKKPVLSWPGPVLKPIFLVINWY